MIEWFRSNETLVWWLAGTSIVTFVASVIAVPLIILQLPADYFSQQRLPAEGWRRRHPVARIVLIIAKNLLGLILVLVGLILSIPPIPGQGFLTIVIGLSLLDFPGKRNVELRILRWGPVQKGINWIRAKGDRPPLKLPDLNSV